VILWLILLLTGVLLEPLTFTRSDLTYAVEQICLHMHDPQESHFAALKCLLCYVRGTVDFGLVLHRFPSAELVVYIDADWARCPDAPLYLRLCRLPRR
jgi:hypothetical protein